MIDDYRLYELREAEALTRDQQLRVAALAEASAAFEPVGIELMHALGDVVEELAERYLSWLKADDEKVS